MSRRGMRILTLLDVEMETDSTELLTSRRPVQSPFTQPPSPCTRHRSAYTYLLLLVLIPSVLFAQRRLQIPAGHGPVVEYEPINLIPEDLSKSRLDINFRISHDYFIFTRDREGSASQPFVAKAEVTVEIFDETDTSVGRDFLHKQMGSDEPPSGSDKKQFLQGIFSFELPPGDYRLYFEINDLQSSRRFIDERKKITLRNFKDIALETSDFSFIEPVDIHEGGPQRFLPLNLGGSVFFGRNFDGYIEFTGTDLDRSLPTVHYHLRFYDPEKGKNVTIVQDTVSRDHMLAGTALDVERTEAGYLYHLVPSSLDQKYTAFLKVDGERLRQGKYKLEIVLRRGEQEKVIRRAFEVQWVNRPLSLRSIDFAISAMRHLVGNEVDKWLAMSDIQKLKSFNEYWREKDGTPGTALNEIQEEYFRRADHAYSNYSSLKQPDGIQTDRGRIFMLYGPPTKTERKLVPKRPPQEVWYYEATGKVFVFEDPSRVGDYQLIKSE